MDKEAFVPVLNEDIPAIAKCLLKPPNDLLGCGYGHQIEKCVLVHLAVDLCSDIKTVRRIREDLQSGKLSRAEAFTEILKDWLIGHDGKTEQQPSVEELISKISHSIKELSKSADKAKVLLLRLSMARKPPIQEEMDTVKDAVTEAEIDEENAEHDEAQKIITAEGKALSNSVILEEIFKKQSFEDRKNFRVVNRFWFEETLQFWRKATRIVILNDDDDDGDKYDSDQDTLPDSEERYAPLPVLEKPHQPGIKMSDFVELHQQDDLSVKILKLQEKERPFRSFQLSAMPDKLEFNLNQQRINNSFWTSCASRIENLKLKQVRFVDKWDFYSLQKLLLWLPNLKALEIHNDCDSNERGMNDISGGEEDDEELPVKLEGFAKRLESLNLDIPLNRMDMEKLLRMCPYLKSLSVRPSANLESLSLSEPTVTGERIKLERFKTSCKGYSTYDFLQLRKYANLMPSSLKHLELSEIAMTRTRLEPFDLYAAIIKFRNLQSLNLHFYVAGNENSSGGGGGFQDWFMDLSTFSFPNLLKLKFKVEKKFYLAPGEEEQQRSSFKFDFGTIKGMPKLKELDVNVGYKDPKYFTRRPGDNDWIYKGPRDKFLSAGSVTDYNLYSEDEPLICKTLKKFSFYGWDVTAQDLDLISKWFPSLTSLSVSTSSEAFPISVDSFRKLEKLEIHSEDFIYLSQLRPLKERNKYLKIIAHFHKPYYGGESAEVAGDLKDGLYYERFG